MTMRGAVSVVGVGTSGLTRASTETPITMAERLSHR